MSVEAKLADLVGKDLSGFKIVEMTEVYNSNEDGRRTSSVGFFKDSDIAKAFAGSQTDSFFFKTQTKLVLTDGKVGYVIDKVDSVTLFDDEKVVLTIKENALKKLTPAERKIFSM